MVLTEGFDCPPAGCIVLARPTKQIGLFRQMAGRGLRPAPGKTNLFLIDHSGAVFRHGLLEDRIEWTLDITKRAENPAHEARDQKAVSRLVECSQCGALRIGGEACGHCGFVPQRRPDKFQKARQCGARTKSGKPCRSPATNKGRCRLHGGARGSGAPSGRRNGQYRHGERTKTAIAERRKFSSLLKMLRAGLR
jgi:superfamily II DNA or RNA helicase